MDWHDYVTGELIEQQLAERRAQAARERLLQAHRAPRSSVRVAIGSALIRLGASIVGPDGATRMNGGSRPMVPRRSMCV
jgi:hypothetical protein